MCALGKERTGFVGYDDPKGAAAEAFRALRTSLSLSPASSKAKLLAVTSSVPSEGKSFVALNLALTYARGGKRVLLVDCDMRRRASSFFPVALGLFLGITVVLAQEAVEYGLKQPANLLLFALAAGADDAEKAGLVRDFTVFAKRLAGEVPSDLMWILPLTETVGMTADEVASLVPERIQGQELFARWLLKNGDYESALAALDRAEVLNDARLEDEKPWTMGRAVYLAREKGEAGGGACGRSIAVVGV